MKELEQAYEEIKNAIVNDKDEDYLTMNNMNILIEYIEQLKDNC